MKEDKLYESMNITKRMLKAGCPFWTNTVVLVILVIGLSAMDAVNLYVVFNALLYESALQLYMLTLGVAVCLNFIPLLGARMLHNFRYGINGSSKLQLIMLGIIFILLFSTTFYLRWTTQDVVFSVEETMENTMERTGEQVIMTSEPQTSDKNIDGQNALTLLLGILPLITSAINFHLSYLTDDPVKRVRDDILKEEVILGEQMEKLEAARIELEVNFENILDEYDRDRLETEEQHLQNVSDYVMAMSRMKLSQKIGTPEAVTALLEK